MSTPDRRAIIIAEEELAKEWVLLESNQLESVWCKDLLAKGWHPVICTQYFHLNWKECHRQCKEIFGENYTWTGEVFWFKNKEDIIVYKLTFSR
jgi:hypothetical protein